jgi:prepilin-type N-terminal cleavage/methylation domain-containing protein
MRHVRKRSLGFTLMEMMIVVAIVAILAAIAIPNYTNYRFRARQGEMSVMLGLMKNAEFTSFAMHDCFVTLARNPPTVPVVTPQQWVSSGSNSPNYCPPQVRAFEDLLVRPAASALYYQYACMARAGVAQTGEFTCSAYGDLDGDTQFFEAIVCTDNGGTGSCPVLSVNGTTGLFPNDIIRVSQGIY